MNWFHKILPTWTGREGLIEMECIGSGLLNKGHRYSATVIVQEIEQRGGFSKVKVKSVSGVSGGDKNHIKDLVPEFIPNCDIQWLEGSNE